jgi:isopenicillin N synthase-like dioxygenase
MKDRVLELSLAHYLHGDVTVRSEFCDALFGGLKRHGFIVLRDHAIAPALIDRAYALTREFFAQPPQEKLRYSAGPRGYAPLGCEHAKDRSIPDLKEFFQIGSGTAPSNLWPERPDGFEATFVALFDALQATGRVILEALTPALKLAPDFFDARIAGRNSVLRLLHYPPLAGNETAGSIRSAAHEDINLITLLLAPQGPGLELLDRKGQWLSVETSRNNLIVDSGDMLALLTNEMIPATTHRVVNPSIENASRYTLPFFMHPDPDVILRCVPSCVGKGAKHADIRAGTFLEQRLAEIGLLKTS